MKRYTITLSFDIDLMTKNDLKELKDYLELFIDYKLDQYFGYNTNVDDIVTFTNETK